MDSKVKKIIDQVQKNRHIVMKVYIKFLRKIICRILPKFFKIKKEFEKDFIYTTICSKNSFDMVLASLYSLFKNSKILPRKIIIVSDGSWNENDGKAFFYKYKLPISFLSWRDCASYYVEKCPELLKWAEKQIWGKKMAAILYLSEKNKVLFADPDVLWYASPLTDADINKCIFKVSVDNSTNYDQQCLRTCNLDSLISREPINCGVVYITGGMQILNSESLNCIKYESENPGSFAEQTVFAALDLKFNNRWKMSEITSEIDDLFEYMPFRKNIHYDGMIARHYLYALKGIYWKEYTKMLLFK